MKKIREIEARTILQKIRSHDDYWFKADYNMNLYKGCSHGCIYCDSRSSCYRVDNFDEVRVKKNCLMILEKELYKNRRGIVGMGAMSDAYNHFEPELQYSRKALQLLEKYNYGIQMSTKSKRILNDIDIIERISRKASVNVAMTITTSEDNVSKLIEPQVCVSSERFEVIRELSKRGIFCGVIFSPMLPFITDSEENVRNMVQMAHAAGASYIFTYYAVTLRENQRDYYYDCLDRIKPGLSDVYHRTYGQNYVCVSKNADRLRKVFEHECERYGLLYRMKEINEAYYKKEEIKQISLF